MPIANGGWCTRCRIRIQDHPGAWCLGCGETKSVIATDALGRYRELDDRVTELAAVLNNLTVERKRAAVEVLGSKAYSDSQLHSYLDGLAASAKEQALESCGHPRLHFRNGSLVCRTCMRGVIKQPKRRAPPKGMKSPAGRTKRRSSAKRQGQRELRLLDELKVGERFRREHSRAPRLLPSSQTIEIEEPE